MFPILYMLDILDLINVFINFLLWVMKEFGVCTDDGFDDSEYTYEEVAVEEDFESEGDIESEDLEATLRSLQKLSFLLGNNINNIGMFCSLKFFLTILAPCKQVRVRPLFWFSAFQLQGKGRKRLSILKCVVKGRFWTTLCAISAWHTVCIKHLKCLK